ncbi:ferredoxin--NADP reductase [Flammeovirga sp. MY04]|uniref:ferredoxin--NADP reductase n=1 Tax=Flammeovirga sp. MY04 TaxID=1191459 RepID=UPI00080626F0|nr:ferredoxin--NADP reductase [Flammeovirga sp. MY04]ANQ50314.1 ferredoxin--NADP reductase [Flammeovirga sp. MY04]
MNKYTLKVKDVVKETSDAVTIKLKQPLFKKVQFTAGQFISVYNDIDSKKTIRSYSVSSAPHLDATLDITIKRVEGGLVSNYLNDTVKAGDSLEISDAMGTFVLEADNSKTRNIFLWAAGSGISPLFSMLKSILFFEKNSNVYLIYGNRNEDSIIFNEHLNELKSKFEGRLEIIHVLSQPSPEWGGFKGRIDDVMAVNVLNRLTLDNSEHFLCGPEGMMTSVESALKRFKVPASKVYKESFVPVDNAESVNVDLGDEMITLVVDGEEHQVEAKAGVSILDAGLDAGLDIPYSCQNGVCTACKGKCVSGKVEMGDSVALSQSEKNEGYVLTCISHAVSKDVKIDYS